MKPHVWICINGIRTNPGDDQGWTDRATTGLMLRAAAQGRPAYAEKYEYHTLALTRRLHQERRAQGITKMVAFWFTSGATISLVAHSNGCALAERVLDIAWKKWPEFRFHSVHFYAPASDGQHLARALLVGQLGHAYLHGQTQDAALRLGRWSRRLLGWAGLGYGDLGLRVTAYASAVPHVTAYATHGRDHSLWLKRDAVFERTLDNIYRRDLQQSEKAADNRPGDDAIVS